MVMAQSARVLVFDNVSHLSGNASDLFAKLSTGAGLALRKRYTDSDEKVISAMLAVILNRIPDFFHSSRSDLVDRSICVTLKPISSVNRRSSKSPETDFEVRRPLIFGEDLTQAVIYSDLG